MENLQKEIDDAIAEFCPFGYGDIQCAVEAIAEAEVSESLYSICEDFADQMGSPIASIDPVGAVYEHILQIVRQEIIDSIDGEDIMDYVFVASNFLATTYDTNDEGLERLQRLYDESTNDWSETALWFFESCDVHLMTSDEYIQKHGLI